MAQQQVGMLFQPGHHLGLVERDEIGRRRGRCAVVGHQLPPRMLWPVFFQSARKASSPLSVSGCFTSALSTAGGTVQTSAPSLAARSEEHTSELQSLMRISYAVFCLKKKTIHTDYTKYYIINNINIKAYLQQHII